MTNLQDPHDDGEVLEPEEGGVMLYVVMVTAAQEMQKHVQSMEHTSRRHHRRREQLFMNYEQQTLRQSWPAASFDPLAWRESERERR